MVFTISETYYTDEEPNCVTDVGFSTVLSIRAGLKSFVFYIFYFTYDGVGYHLGTSHRRSRKSIRMTVAKTKQIV